jgi:cyclopropane-fatty-acyl-phospholipid synthase
VVLLTGLLKQLIRTGQLTVITADGSRHLFGPGGLPAVTIRLHDRQLPYRLFLHPELALGEAYMEGSLTLESGTLQELLHLCTASVEALNSHPLQRVRHRIDLLAKSLQQNNRVPRAQSHVAHHYDLGGTLYELFLGADRQYSCAYYPQGDESLEEAQLRKQAHIAAKLLLQPGMRVLDIGSGWGGLGLFLARTARVNVTGVTLSAEQLEASRERAAAAGQSQQVQFHLRDYRLERGMYDRIVSVGMFEHVGARHYDEFFNAVRDLLHPDGIALLHSIGRMSVPATTNPWVRKYIFPGGYTPALSEVFASIERSGLWVTDVEILRLHYADTLRAWSRRFARHREQIRSLYDERFCRMWEFYLAVSEIAFRNLDQMVFQIQLARRRDAVPRTRDYVTQAEQAVRQMRPEHVA